MLIVLGIVSLLQFNIYGILDFMSKKVAIKGYAASFHDVAARELVGQDCSIIPCDTFDEVVMHVQRGQVDCGVMAVENSNHGSIPESVNPLMNSGLTVHSELKMRIDQCLLGLPGAELRGVREVYSDPIALSQCSVFLQTSLPVAKLIDHPDTAGAAADIQRWQDPTKACIASRAAAELHGLEVLAPGIETDAENYTRFILFSK